MLGKICLRQSSRLWVWRNPKRKSRLKPSLLLYCCMYPLQMKFGWKSVNSSMNSLRFRQNLSLLSHPQQSFQRQNRNCISEQLSHELCPPSRQHCSKCYAQHLCYMNLKSFHKLHPLSHLRRYQLHLRGQCYTNF